MWLRSPGSPAPWPSGSTRLKSSKSSRWAMRSHWFLGTNRTPGEAPLEAELLVVQICEFQEDGDGFYRLHEPSRQLARLPGVVTIDCDAHHRLLPQLAAEADVLVLLGF